MQIKCDLTDYAAPHTETKLRVIITNSTESDKLWIKIGDEKAQVVIKDLIHAAEAVYSSNRY